MHRHWSPTARSREGPVGLPSQPTALMTSCLVSENPVVDSHGAHLFHHSKKTTGRHESRGHYIGGHNITVGYVSFYPSLLDTSVSSLVSEMLHPKT